MAGDQAAKLLGQFLAEHDSRIARRASKGLRHELEEGASREHRRAAAPAYLGELGAILMERGEDAPRLWGEAVRHHGGEHFAARLDLGDLLREFKVLHAAVIDEWDRRVGPMDADTAILLTSCMAEGAAACVSDYVRNLRASEVEFREAALIQAILAHLDEGVMLVESDQTLSFATRPAFQLLGPGLREVIGRPVTDPAMARLLADLQASTLEGGPVEVSDLPAGITLRTGTAPEPMVLRIVSGGAERVLEIAALPIWDEEGANGREHSLRGVILTVRDRTADFRKTEALRAANRELAELHTRVLQRSRAQAMGELASGASHALNNLLNAMHLRLRLLRESPGPEQVESLERSVGDIAALVARLQGFVAQRPAAPPEPTELDAVVREALALVRPEGLRAGEGAVTVRPRLACESQVRAQAGELRELLVSLLLYAREHLADGGMLEAETESSARGAICRLTFQASSAAAAPAVLEPFADREGSQELALAVSAAQRALTAWGGEMLARPLDRGAEFILRFAPAREARVEVPKAGEEAVRSAARGVCRVLVVDDDPDNATMLAEVLAAEGHSTETANSGREAIAKFRQAEFDVALIDLLMPDMQGTDIARTFQELRPGARLALVTGWELSDEQRQRVPVAAVFRKPVDLAQLLEFIGPATGPTEAPAAPV